MPPGPSAASGAPHGRPRFWSPVCLCLVGTPPGWWFNLSKPQFILLGIGDPSDCLISLSSSGETPRSEQIKSTFEKYKELYSRQ